jgi:hypothetical protein
MEEYPEHIWLIRGYAGSGKDTAAAIIAKNLARANITAFASAVKDFVAAAYDIDRTSLDTQEGKKREVCKEGVTARDLLIEHAQSEKVKHGDPAIWAKRVHPPPNTAHWILSDWRFLAELKCFRSRFPKSKIHTIQIVRTGVMSMETATEHELDGFVCDVVLDNSSSRISLGNQIERKIHAEIERTIF